MFLKKMKKMHLGQRDKNSKRTKQLKNTIEILKEKLRGKMEKMKEIEDLSFDGDLADQLRYIDQEIHDPSKAGQKRLKKTVFDKQTMVTKFLEEKIGNGNFSTMLNLDGHGAKQIHERKMKFLGDHPKSLVVDEEEEDKLQEKIGSGIDLDWRLSQRLNKSEIIEQFYEKQNSKKNKKFVVKTPRAKSHYRSKSGQRREWKLPKLNLKDKVTQEMTLF
jgi:hypothetical protein